jgi:hypothetical protein
MATVLRAASAALWFVGGVIGYWIAGELGLAIGIIVGGFVGFYIAKHHT